LKQGERGDPKEKRADNTRIGDCRGRTELHPEPAATCNGSITYFTPILTKRIVGTARISRTSHKAFMVVSTKTDALSYDLR